MFLRTVLPVALILVLGCGAAAPPEAHWSVIGPGGGGAQFLPTLSPHDPSLALVACDMTGSYITYDGGANWRMFNLRGRTSIFAFDPVAKDTIYAYGLGLFRSVDRGKLWQLVYPDAKDVRSVPALGDHAEEEIVTASGAPARISAFTVDPADSKVLYAAFQANKQTVLRISSDWGKSWRDAATLQDGARAIYIDPASPRANRTVYVVGRSKVAVREAGAWKEGPAAGARIVSASGGFAGSGGKLIVYAAVPGGLALSRDGGSTWSTVLSGANVRAVATSIHHPGVAYVSYDGLKKGGNTFFGVAVTRDFGQNWTYPWQESDRAAANVDQGGWLNPALGPGWGENPLELGVSPINPDLAIGTDMGRTLKTSDGGKNWQAVYSRPAGAGSVTTGLNVTTAYGVHFDPFDAKRMYISYTDIGLFRSDDGGNAWRGAGRQGVPRQWTNTTYWLEFDPAVKGRLWAVMSGVHDLPRPKMWRHSAVSKYNGGVLRSDDGGNTWTVLNKGLPETAATHILLDPRSPKEARVLYVAGYGRGVYKSVDGGASWQLKNSGLPAHEPFAWRISRAADGTLYLVIARRSDDGSIGTELDGSLYRSRNGAESWEKVPLPAGVNGPNGLQIDPSNANRLYLAAWGRDVREGNPGGGIYLSTDAGATWKQVLNRDQHVYDVTIDSSHPATLYACGFEDSVWRSTDRGETWSRVRGYNFKWGHRVIPDPARPGMIYVTTFGGSVWHGPAAGDPSAAEDIATPALSFSGAKR
jgi:photosystem II stability/assembly factor-like uncharacterized protein